ncbi:MAG: DUF3795 domain-containing protein [Chloroflexota bacterium]
MRAGLKKYPIVGACGLDCSLCPRYHTIGPSRCPGCAGPDFEQKHPACGFITCCVKQKHLETCAQCLEWESCARVSRVMKASQQADSFISYRPLASNYAFIQKHGIEEFARLEMAKLEFLRRLLERYDDGRSKSFYCTACQLMPLDGLKAAMAEAGSVISKSADIKEKARLVRAAISRWADASGIDLRLRK